ncbi:hypothetical protein TVAG_284380 [Trichomonas vaginalis G3]|uniref:Uncharacterized protein n=1 Tax=Trichomonas vaginalis (strain ATCC PRA-98 / G3) TaxID=412133 RepID=A2EN96_TRIV3|nr:hypothetical protein TVAGG3_0355950 [Trichomonas vaginalis G3]EAY05855.1 hypothetical protein TVAG_284380 [Trichomonas vaginalis G3]KAI5531629.1 hypothetical protein TVAGG3_0355950 [Trichomonas vaginalis G3]|eukprot:XP_001318078.1 hypothetical protein [Trichomonas vaginalis G3]
MESKSCLTIKLLSITKGLTLHIVEPDSLINVLRQTEGSDNIFIYKGMKLSDTFSFRYYNISNWDLICSVDPFRTESKINSKFGDDYIQEIKNEKFKLLERYINKVHSFPRLYRKSEYNLRKLSNLLDGSDKTIVEQPFLSPPKLECPSSLPLPRFWNL